MFGGLFKEGWMILVAGKALFNASTKAFLHSLRKAAKGFWEVKDVCSIVMSTCQIFKRILYFNLESVAYLCMDAISYEDKNCLF